VWCRLSEIANYGGGKTPSMDNKQYWSNGTNLWITSKDMKCERITDSMMKISNDALDIMTQYEPGTLLMVTRSGILRHSLPIAILEEKATVNQDLKTISLHLKETHEYVYYAIKARERYILKEYHKDGTTVDSINFEKFAEILLPIPPYDEQKRIVIAIKQWLSFIDQLEQDVNDLETSIEQTKTKILELAMHGKLVPQDPNDEPAIELLKRINPKFTPCDNAHDTNQLPKGWCWGKLGNIGKWQSGSTPSRLKKDYYGGDIPWLKTGDLNDGYIFEIPEYITQKALDETSVKLNPIGSVLIAMYGATIGKIGILTFPATTNQACCACVDYQGIEQKYLFYFLLSHREAFIMMGGGGAQPNISKEKITESLMPIPPNSEQQRIIARIEELFAILDEIQKSIEA
jgi:type I restriction enzyme S subunit